jgi:hypothetical protein
MGAVMQERFCSVIKHKKQMYIERHAYANGPRCTVFPPKPLYRGLTIEQLAEEIDSALNDYSSLRRPIYPQEWKEREDQLLTYFGEKSSAAFQRKKKDITIRYDVARGIYVLMDDATDAVTEVGTALDAARAIYDRIGEPTTEPPAEGELRA